MNILEFMAEGRLCCLQFGTVMNKALLNILVRVLRCMNYSLLGTPGHQVGMCAPLVDIAELFPER